MYYFNSRYYDPETGRFINADGAVSTGTGILGYNMFSYCNNDPVGMVDDGGSRPLAMSDTVESAEDQMIAAKFGGVDGRFKAGYRMLAGRISRTSRREYDPASISVKTRVLPDLKAGIGCQQINITSNLRSALFCQLHRQIDRPIVTSFSSVCRIFAFSE